MINVSSENSSELLVFELSGRTTFEEITTAVKEHYGSAKRNVLWIARDVDLADLSNDELFEISTVEKVYAKHFRTAAVGCGPLEYGMLNMYRAFAELSEVDPELKIFKSLEDAKLWFNTFDAHCCVELSGERSRGSTGTSLLRLS